MASKRYLATVHDSPLSAGSTEQFSDLGQAVAFVIGKIDDLEYANESIFAAVFDLERFEDQNYVILKYGLIDNDTAGLCVENRGRNIDWISLKISGYSGTVDYEYDLMTLKTWEVSDPIPF